MVGVVFAFNVETANGRIEAIMHSLNSMAGIRKYRIHDEVPITLSSEDASLEVVSVRGEEGEKLNKKRNLFTFFVRVRAILIRVVSHFFS